MFDRRLIQNFDWILLFLLLLLAGIGILNLYSATYQVRNEAGSQVFIKMTTFDYHTLERLAMPLYFLSIALLVLVFFIGKVSSGSQRWLNLGPVSFQPSELAKIAVILVLAKYLTIEDKQEGFSLRDFLLPIVLIAAPSILILKEPDLGTTLLLIVTCFSIFFFVNVKWKSLAVLSLPVLSVIPIIWFRLQEYQRMRVLSFIKPGMDPQGVGYHISQSKIAIGSGLLWGKGYMKGTQARLLFLPEQHTDFIFSVLAEEWGFIFSILLLLIYLFLILWALNISRNSKDRFGSIVAVGIAAIIFWHVVINVGMVTGIFPVVGIPLLLLSYGGSSLITTMASLGLLMNISMRRFMFSE
jgi:rod shape determining protein RodA